MQLRQVIFLILGFISSTAYASGSRPIEVLSDAYGAGVPTQYTVLRDNSRLTFSHPYFGQFTRAEIRTSDQSGITTTRFVLSADGKTYRPVMLNEEPHMIHNMANDDGAICEDTRLFATTASEIMNIEAAAKFDAAVKKKMKELKAAKFFDASCFAKKMSKEDQDTLFTGVAQVLVREQSTRSTNGPRYLTCLNEYGFADESGQIEALVKQSLTHKLSDKKRLYVACTSDSDAYPGSYNTASNSITLKWRATANPPSIAATFLEESLHAVGLEQHKFVEPLVNCCARGLNCQKVAELSSQIQHDKRKATVLSSLNSQVRLSENAIYGLKAVEIPTQTDIKANSSDTERSSRTLAGPAYLSSLQDNIQTLQNEASCRSLVRVSVPHRMPKPIRFPHFLFLDSAEASSCSDEDSLPQKMPTAPVWTEAHLKSQVDKLPDNSSTADLIALGTRTSPIPWSGPVTQGVDTDALALAAATRSKNKPTRGIASISTENPGATLGSSSNRRDLQKGRATFLIDTAEKAAREVASTLTAETISKRSVARNEAYKEMQKSGSTQFVVASLKDKPVQFAKLDGLNLGFENPFLKSAPKIKEQTLSQTLAATRNAGQQKPLDPIPLSGSDGARSSEKIGIDSADAPVPKGRFASSATTPTITAAQAQPNPRQPAAQAQNQGLNFKSATKQELTKFLLATYRRVYDELGKQEFTEALARHQIQIRDHEQRPHGAIKPQTTFVYRKDLDRLVQTRTEP